jgi:hypothetical protein
MGLVDVAIRSFPRLDSALVENERLAPDRIAAQRTLVASRPAGKALND